MPSIKFPGFTKGLSLKNNYLGEPGFARIGHLKFSDRPGVLTARGGWDDWDTTGTDYSYLLGLKRWYREDGGVNFFFMATDGSGATTLKLREYFLHNKTSTVYATLSGNYDYEAPMLWIDCGSQLIALPLTYLERPWSVKLQGYANGSNGGVEFKKLGLDFGVDVLSVVIGYIINGVNQQVMNGLDDGVYKYKYTYSYGTLTEPEFYGESGFSAITTVNLTGTLNNNGIIQLNGFTPVGDATLPLVTRINIYRTLKNADTYYKVGELSERGRTNFNDTRKDSLVDLSQTGPTLSGIGVGIRCGLWHPDLQRLFWFGMDGFFHWSAASFPDINPTQQKIAVGSTGYFGNAIFLIRDTMYCFKEDGIYVVGGESPNYFSKKVSPVQCFARAGFAEMPDGIYFPGVESGKVRFYRFNGNSAIPISEDINSIIPANKSYFFKKLFAKRIGDEYWVSLMCRDQRYARFEGLPFNNLVFAYDLRYKGWTHFNAQATSFEVFDGPGDSGEVFLLESDPIGNATVGNFFRYNPYAWKFNGTTYTPAGARTYSKTVAATSLLTLGPIKGRSNTRENPGGLQFLSCERLRIRYRWIFGNSPTAVLYDDSDVLQKVIGESATFSSEPLEKYGNLVLTGDASPVWGTGKWGTAVLVAAPYEEAIINIKQTTRDLGFALDVKFAESSSTQEPVEIESMEVDFQSSER